MPLTDPDVRISRIRLFRHMGSLRGDKPSRTYWSKYSPAQLSDGVTFGWIRGSMPSPSFPPTVPCPGAPFPPPGPSRFGSPDSSVL